LNTEIKLEAADL